MKRHKHALLMLQLARRDLKALGNMTDPEKFDDAVFGFFAQQAVIGSALVFAGGV
jgi:hypothetical protein